MNIYKGDEVDKDPEDEDGRLRSKRMTGGC